MSIPTREQLETYLETLRLEVQDLAGLGSATPDEETLRQLRELGYGGE